MGDIQSSLIANKSLTHTCSTVYVPIEAQYPIETCYPIDAHPPFREQKWHANVYICNKMESLSNQNDI